MLRVATSDMPALAADNLNKVKEAVHTVMERLGNVEAAVGVLMEEMSEI